MKRAALLWIAAAAVLWASGAVSSEEPTATAPRSFTLVHVGPGVYAAIARAGNRSSVGNAGFVVGSSAVLVVDSFATPAAAEELLSEIRRITALPVRWLVLTHYHLDHVGGSAVFVRAGAVVLAHENVRAWVRTENLKWRAEIKPEERAMLAALVLPEATHREGLTLWLGERRMDVLARPGHTGGDSVVLVPDAGVVFGGDLFWRNTIPNLVDADTGAWLDTLDGFLRSYPAATFVPGHGEVGRALDVRYFRDYLSGLRLSVAQALEEGLSGPPLVEKLLPQHRARYGSWAWFDQFAGKNIERTEEELRGTKRFPPTPASAEAAPVTPRSLGAPGSVPTPPSERAAPTPGATPPA